MKKENVRLKHARRMCKHAEFAMVYEIKLSVLGSLDMILFHLVSGEVFGVTILITTSISCHKKARSTLCTHY